MKKLMVIGSAVLAMLALSCNNALQQLQHTQASVTIGIAGDGSARALKANGLPELDSPETKIEIVVTKQAAPSMELRRVNFGEGKKSLTVTLPVGEKIRIAVTVKHGAVQWNGFKDHTVKAGDNTIAVKLEKSAVAIDKLLFGTNKTDVTTHYDYTLTLKIGAQEITKERIIEHSFCRDNKGRTWLAYNTGSVWTVERYTSEGNKETIPVRLPEGAKELCLASDHATGNVYAALKKGHDNNPSLWRFEENDTGITCEQLSLPDSTALISIEKLAVHNNSAVIYSGRHGLVLYRINGADVSHLVTYSHASVEDDTRITLGHRIGTARGEVQDLYMTGDALYVLFSSFGDSANDYYALGGVVKYSYSDGTITKIKPIGIKDTHTTIPQHISEGVPRIIQAGADEFYGPVKVIGFDENNLYIADDGAIFEVQNGRPRLTANKNRIAVLNKANDTVSFKDTDEAAWLSEHPVWEKPKDNPLVFFSLNENNGNTLNNLILSNDVSGSSAINVTSNIELDTDNSRNIFYTFDKDNNFYLATKDKLKKFTKSDHGYTEDTAFTDASAGVGPYQNPAYDIVTEKLYAVGKYSGSGPSILVEYTDGRWAGHENNNINGSNPYAVYNGMIYGNSGENKVTINAIDSTDHPKLVYFTLSQSTHAGSSDIFVADNICYVLIHLNAVTPRDTAKVAVGYFDVTKISELPMDSASVPTVPASQVIELPIAGLTKFENLKFTGYRNGKLYIAVDGIKRSIVEGAPKLENINKTVSFSTSAKTFDSPVNAPNSITWSREKNEWHGTKTLVWKRQSPPDQYTPPANKQDYYQIANAGDSLTAFLGTGLDVFCHDADGNFYIAANDSSNNKLYRYTLEDNGNYGSGVDRPIYSAPSVIAVSASSVPDDAEKTVLFYYTSPPPPPVSVSSDRQIQRIAWSTGNFASSNSQDAMKLTGFGQDDTITAIAANKDGIFVAIKTVTSQAGSSDKKYKIEVKKYAHQKLSGESPASAVSTVTVVSETSVPNSEDEHIEENLNALFIQDGVLYALTTKQKGTVGQAGSGGNAAAVFIGGKLLKIGNTASFGSPATAEVLYQNEDFTPAASGQFAPYRFIAVKPKKLVIASDGYYAQGSPVAPDGNKNAVFTFDIGSWDNPARNTVSSGVIFSKELATSTGFLWE